MKNLHIGLYKYILGVILHLLQIAFILLIPYHVVTWFFLFIMFTVTLIENFTDEAFKFPYCCLQFLFEHILRQCNACSCCIKHFYFIFFRWNRTTWVSTSHFCLFGLFCVRAFFFVNLFSFIVVCLIFIAVFAFDKTISFVAWCFPLDVTQTLECTEMSHAFEKCCLKNVRVTPHMNDFVIVCAVWVLDESLVFCSF